MSDPRCPGGTKKGRPTGSARPGRLVTLKLSLAARAALDLVPRPERGRWVSALIETATAATKEK